jgi:hypothetical protein
MWCKNNGSCTICGFSNLDTLSRINTLHDIPNYPNFSKTMYLFAILSTAKREITISKTIFSNFKRNKRCLVSTIINFESQESVTSRLSNEPNKKFYLYNLRRKVYCLSLTVFIVKLVIPISILFIFTSSVELK